jgi:phosphoribosylformylglycinamidine cyclo-ligase
MSQIDYKSSGVDISEGNKFVNNIKSMVASTLNCNVPEGIGGFAGLFSIHSFKKMQEPMLVSGTDGVGTKLKISFEMQKYDTIGVDLVAMCVNDLIVTGAQPLFFLDYIATGKLSSDKMTEIVKGITEGCKQADVALIGGETAEMPGMYNNEEFDLAGFSVGIVDKPKLITGSDVKKGNILIGLSSSGFHSNGYSLLRKLFFETLNMKLTDVLDNGQTLGEMLLTPTKIYVKPILHLLNKGFTPLAMIHITGGGFYENIPRVLPENCGVKIFADKFPNLFFSEYVRELNKISKKELYRVFNMGIGYILIVKEEEVDLMLKEIKKFDKLATVIGEVVEGNKNVNIRGVDF